MSVSAPVPERVGDVDLRGRTLLVPSMHPAGSELLAACFRAIGVPALVMATGANLDLGREHTSGKECYPCQLTLGDLLGHLQAERSRLGPAFDARRYAYFMPGATGPCRFGMYNRLHRLVLDRFPELRELPIASITTADSYGAAGLVPARDATAFRLLAYLSVIAADALDRILWRSRPYERAPGSTEAVHAAAVARLARAIEGGGLRRDFKPLRAIVGEAALAARDCIDPALPRRPRIGVVGEIYLRSHPGANQGLLRELERHGAEVVCASLAEWITFVTYCRVREQRRLAAAALRSRNLGAAGAALRGWAGQAVEYRYLNARRRWLYAAAERHLDIVPDHDVHAAGRRLEGERHFSFDVGTEAVLSIGGALEHAAHGCDGVVNVYPFTCMPGTIATAVLAPLLGARGVPYLEVPCDETRRPNRETQVRTFVWQALQRRAGGRRAG